VFECKAVTRIPLEAHGLLVGKRIVSEGNLGVVVDFSGENSKQIQQYRFLALLTILQCDIKYQIFT
jgi:hypothetical protein